MGIVLATVKDGRYVRNIDRSPGYLHYETTLEMEEAQRVDEPLAHDLCDLDFFGVPYAEGGYLNNKCVGPEFMRVTVAE